ncbi:LuxR C-terminal-related transcriptional regulator [Flavobacterium sp. DG1-102-2]|uniref:LuxR C-terminal-related transcriptional regulator n=1 Tax=Flavobacterium sp. DG1-102-2 TaxID=3081663 RepID=UPI002949FE00|nr:LuxR C-terminal-related transcriptional regulator [Flavobacterium sp. DG1-102-2]MDV6168137.1 LuxR C-terminal-related transcriptional regulator [Flavobacterium sp. DG1-102-2]
MFLKNIFSVFLLFCFSIVSSQELLPFVENFTKSEYNGDNQVWNVVQGNDNAMYFANNHYFIRYNGVKWEKYSLPNKTIIRSVFVDGDKIYCGSYREFGFFKRVEGKMVYTSISKINPKLFSGNADNEEVWKIFKKGSSIYFQGFNEIYVYDGTAIKKIRFPEQISYCYVIDNVIYVATVRKGIFVMNGETFTKMPNWNLAEGNIIHSIEKKGGVFYIFTKNNGILVSNSAGKLENWNNPLNAIIKDNVITAGKFLDDKVLALGTGRNGLYVINLADNTYKNINRNNSIKNNTVLSIAFDKEKDLWLGLDNGISHIEINSPVSIFLDNSGLLGSVYSLAALNNGGHLLVTNHGIFTHKNKQLNAIPNSQGQVWDIYKEGDRFIIGHNDGTFLYDGNALQWKNPVNGGWKFLKSQYDNVYFQANYTGIAVYKDINDLTKVTKLDKLNKPIRNIAQNKPGEIWAADNNRSLYRITYSKDFKVKEVENISSTNKISGDYGVKIFNFRNEILFLINNVWYVYNGIANKLEEDKIFNTAFKGISDIIPVDDDQFMVVKASQLYLITAGKNDFLWKLLPEKYYRSKLILDNIQVYNDNGQLLVNLDDGFIAFTPTERSEKRQKISIEGFYDNELIDYNTKIKYNQSVEIDVKPEFYGFSRPDLTYTLNGSDEFLPVGNGHLTLNNLGGGKQELEVFYNDGKNNIKLGDFKFYVSSPWYFSFWMILVYVLFVAIVFFLYYRWNKVRYMEQIKLNEEELKHRRQILELEMEAENKLRKQQHEKHMLEVEVQSKASEVAGKSLSIAKHNEMIESIQEALEVKQNTAELKSAIKKIIKTNTLSKNEWQSFEKNLVKSHEEFVDRLSKKYPTLTSKDIKLCIYLKMNLSSKEIAPLMNISYRGVELHRYRLRKKLDITQEESLTRFMINV